MQCIFASSGSRAIALYSKAIALYSKAIALYSRNISTRQRSEDMHARYGERYKWRKLQNFLFTNVRGPKFASSHAIEHEWACEDSACPWALLH